jgi:hypothetical protein
MGFASSSLPMAASNRSKDRSSGFTSRLAGQIAIVAREGSKTSCEEPPEGNRAGCSSFAVNGRHALDCGFHPNRRNRFLTEFSAKPRRCAMPRLLNPLSFMRRIVRSRSSVLFGAISEGRPRVRPNAGNPPNSNFWAYRRILRAACQEFWPSTCACMLLAI